jgi:REP element-mobilizing transposase RayT
MTSMRNHFRQLAFDLRPPAQWGGHRDGAGRKPGPRRRDPHAQRAPLAARHPCHVTLRVRRNVPSLRSARFVREFERSLRSVRERSRFRVVHYALLADHAHFVVEASSARDLSCGMKSLGSRLSRAANRVFLRSGPVLDDRAHVRVLRTPTEVRRAIAYVLLNARRHLAKVGLWVDPRGRIDPASSGRWFDGWQHRPATVGDAPAVARPRSWLLCFGWRRAGLVGLAEIPGSRL